LCTWIYACNYDSPVRLLTEPGNDGIQRTTTQGKFTVRFDDGVLVDGSDTKVISKLVSILYQGSLSILIISFDRFGLSGVDEFESGAFDWQRVTAQCVR
jgi:hypothetical protein